MKQEGFDIRMAVELMTAVDLREVGVVDREELKLCAKSLAQNRLDSSLFDRMEREVRGEAEEAEEEEEKEEEGYKVKEEDVGLVMGLGVCGDEEEVRRMLREKKGNVESVIDHLLSPPIKKVKFEEDEKEETKEETKEVEEEVKEVETPIKREEEEEEEEERKLDEIKEEEEEEETDEEEEEETKIKSNHDMKEEEEKEDVPRPLLTRSFTATPELAKVVKFGHCDERAGKIMLEASGGDVKIAIGLLLGRDVTDEELIELPSSSKEEEEGKEETKGGSVGGGDGFTFIYLLKLIDL